MGSVPSGPDQYAFSESAGGAAACLVRSVNRQLNHSPIESPPTVKKKLCRLMDGLVRADINLVDGAIESLLLQRGGIQKSGLCKELLNDTMIRYTPVVGRRPILKRSVSSVSRGGYGSRRTSAASRSSRRVQFNGDVTVHLISDEGHICTECHLLNSEPHEHRMGTLSRPRYSSGLGLPTPSTPFSHLFPANSPTRLSPNSPLPTQRSPDYDTIQKTVLNSPQLLSPNPDIPRASPNNSPNSDYDNVFYDSITPPSTASPSNVLVEGSSVNFTFIEDSVKGVVLKFVVPLGLEYHPDDIVVKANVNGSKVRVVARKVVPGTNGSAASMEEVSRRYALPMDVDPYAVSARLDIRGNLTVEAPLITLSRRYSMRSGSAPRSAHFSSTGPAHSKDSALSPASSSSRSISL